MKLQIKTLAGSVLLKSEAASLRELVLGAVKSGANLSGATGIPQDRCEWFRKNFKATKQGVIVYKCFGKQYAPSPAWKIEPGAVLVENCNFNPIDDGGCGINFATKEWVQRNHPGAPIWRCLIRWSWLPGVVIPWKRDGKARCERLQLIGLEEEQGKRRSA